MSDHACGCRAAVGSARSPPGSARRGTATSATRPPPISTAALRASPKPESRSCSVRRNAGRTPSLRVGGLRPIRARTRSLRARLGRSEPYRETDSGAVSAGWNPAGAQLRGINSNTPTILGPSGANPVTCGNAQPFRARRPIRAQKQTPARSARSPPQPRQERSTTRSSHRRAGRGSPGWRSRPARRAAPTPLSGPGRHRALRSGAQFPPSSRSLPRPYVPSRRTSTSSRSRLASSSPQALCPMWGHRRSTHMTDRIRRSGGARSARQAGRDGGCPAVH
jgi:hypothetical protein